jgi:hypothetical protein
MIASSFCDHGIDIDTISSTLMRHINKLSIIVGPMVRYEVSAWASSFRTTTMTMEGMAPCDLSYALLSTHVYMTAIKAGLHWHTRKMLLSISRSLSLRVSFMPSEDVLLQLTATRALSRDGVVHALSLLIVKRAVEFTDPLERSRKWGDVPIMDKFADSIDDSERSPSNDWCRFWFDAARGTRDIGVQELISGEWKSRALETIGRDWQSFKASVVNEDKIGQRKGVGGAFVTTVLDGINAGDLLHCDTFDFVCVNACRKVADDRVSLSLKIPHSANGSPPKLNIVTKSASRRSCLPRANAPCSLHLPSDLVSKVLSYVIVNEVSTRERFVDFLYVTNFIASEIAQVYKGNVAARSRAGVKRKLGHAAPSSDVPKRVISLGRAACLGALSRMNFFVCDCAELLPSKSSTDKGSERAVALSACPLLWPKYFFNEFTTHTQKEITSLHPYKLLPVSVRVCEVAHAVFGTSSSCGGTVEVVIDTDALDNELSRTVQVRQGIADMIATVKTMTLYGRSEFRQMTGNIVETLSGAVSVRSLRIAGPLSNHLAACSMFPSSIVRRIMRTRGGQFSNWNTSWYAFMSIASCFRFVETIKFGLETKNANTGPVDDIWLDDDTITPLEVRVVPTDKFEMFPALVDVVVLDAKCNYAPVFKHSSGVQSQHPRLSMVPYADGARRTC